jgi:hypothetical protein
MDNNVLTTPVSQPKTRKTYNVAGTTCLCWKGALYAPQGGATSVAGSAVVVAESSDAVELDNGEVWVLTTREAMKAKGSRPSQSDVGVRHVDRGTFVPTGPRTLYDAMKSLEDLDTA